MMKFLILLLITVVFAFASVTGKITKIDGDNVTLNLTQGKLNKGDSIKLIYTSMSGMELDVGEGKVVSTSKKDTVIFLDKKKATPRKGMQVSLIVTKSNIVVNDSKVNANANDSMGLYMTGWKYYRGIDTKKDYKKAIQWYKKAALKNNVFAQHDLGVIYKDGLGVKVDYGKAFYWLKKAVSHNYASAENHLAWLYYKGYGVEKDLRQSFKLYMKSAKQGYPEAQDSVAWMYKHAKGVNKDYTKAFYWCSKAAYQEYPGAQNNLGVMYVDGIGVTKSKKNAIYWYKKAARNGNKNAQNNLKAGNLSW